MLIVNGDVVVAAAAAAAAIIVVVVIIFFAVIIVVVLTISDRDSPPLLRLTTNRSKRGLLHSARKVAGCSPSTIPYLFEYYCDCASSKRFCLAGGIMSILM